MTSRLGAYETSSDAYQDEAWYIEAVEWIFSFADGWFQSPGDRCNDEMSSWKARYACTFREAGGACPGAPDPRRAALAAQNDPAGAERIRARLANPRNDGLAPTVKEMQDPVNALLWVNAAMGGWDCISSSDPSLPADMTAWVESATPGWDPSQEDPEEVEGWAALIYQEAAERGREAAEDLLREAAQQIAGAVPDSWRRALERGVADYYAERGGAAIRGNIGPIILTVTAGALLWQLVPKS